MSETIISDPISAVSEKPAKDELVEFPPFPGPTDDAFEDDISEEEREFYKNKFPDLNTVKKEKLHCSACDRHLGCAARNESRMRMHPMLRTLVCHTCHTFYNSGEFDKGEDGSELYCRWCGQGGQVYCCSDCPVVFCAKCIKRNFGMPKIKEIENTDDWKCFKCNSKCLWDLRAVCWALLRFCDLRNKITYKTTDQDLKESYQKLCALDESECCKAKITKKKEKDAKKKEITPIKTVFQRAAANKAANAIDALNAINKAAVNKIPPSIQVKKFASINLDESPPKDRKPQKRPADKDHRPGILKNPITVSNRLLNPIAAPPLSKKIRMPSLPMPVQAIRIPQKTYQNTYTRIRPKPPSMTQMPQMPPPLAVFNNYLNNNIQTMMNNYTSDNINLSLENLTQGLDMSAVAGMSDNDVVCTPDFPLEPLCEVTDEAADDDVQCMTPGPMAAPKPAAPPPPPPPPPPLAPRSLDDLSSDNIIQMTENDVTVNAATGGLKFRVDPQTLSSNKMYRLPDGRVFAINANPNMPGGYSATIVALTENNSPKPVPKGSTYAAKLSAVSTPQSPSPTPPSRQNHTPSRVVVSKRTSQGSTTIRSLETSSTRVCNLKIPVEWYRYNLIDAVDALEYSLTRLQKLKKEASTMFLRTRNVEEMRSLHKTLDSLLKTSSSRFNEIRDNLNKEMKQYIKKKNECNDDISDDDDDVEILNDLNDDPIFIDENSVESNNANETYGNITTEVDLTGPASSEHNDSSEKSTDKVEKDSFVHSDLSNENSLDKSKEDEDTAVISEKVLDKNKMILLQENMQKNDIKDPLETNDNLTKLTKNTDEMNGDINQSDDIQNDNDINQSEDIHNDTEENKNDKTTNDEDSDGKAEKDTTIESLQNDSETQEIEKDNNASNDNIHDINENDDGIQNNDTGEKKVQDVDMSKDKIHDSEMTEELIDSLLKDDNGGDDSESVNLNCMEIPEDFTEP